MILPWYLINTVHRANLDTGLTAGATIGVNHGQDLGDDLARFARQRRCCHIVLPSFVPVRNRDRRDRVPAAGIDKTAEIDIPGRGALGFGAILAKRAYVVTLIMIIVLFGVRSSRHETTGENGDIGRKGREGGPNNRVSFADSRMPAVLATPWLVAYLEHAARDAIAPYLESHGAVLVRSSKSNTSPRLLRVSTSLSEPE